MGEWSSWSVAGRRQVRPSATAGPPPSCTHVKVLASSWSIVFLLSAEDTVAMIRDEGGEAIAHVADITDPTSCSTIPDAAVSTFGGLDVLHNNVGIGGEISRRRGSMRMRGSGSSTSTCRRCGARARR